MCLRLHPQKEVAVNYFFWRAERPPQSGAPFMNHCGIVTKVVSVLSEGFMLQPFLLQQHRLHAF